MEVHILVCANRVDFMGKARYDEGRAGRNALHATAEGRCLKYKKHTAIRLMRLLHNAVDFSLPCFPRLPDSWADGDSFTYKQHRTTRRCVGRCLFRTGNSIKAPPHNSAARLTMSFSAICGMQIPRFTSSKPSKFAFASDEKIHSSADHLICAVLPKIMFLSNRIRLNKNPRPFLQKQEDFSRLMAN